MKKFIHTSTIQISYCNFVVLLTVVMKVTECLEEPSPEIFLQPRNFNPHPYELTPQKDERNGPVLFPSNSDDNLVEDRSNFVTVRNFLLRDDHPVDNHPYPKVARKRKYRVRERFRNQDRQANDHARIALAKHGSEVLAYPPEQLAKRKISQQQGKDYEFLHKVAHHLGGDDFFPPKYRQQGKDYAFSYKVVDRLRGDDFSHSQSRNSKATNGEYRVKLPDGRVQIVSYTADKNGYKADVKYTENEGVTDQRGAPHQEDQAVQIQRIPVREIYPLEKEKPLDYENDVQSPNHDIVVLQAVVPTQISRNFNGHGSIVVTPSPAYLNAVENRELQRQSFPKVQIYTSNARDYSIGSFIPSTATPYLEKYSNNLERRVIFPEITNNGNHGLSAPTTPSSFVLTGQQGVALDNIKLVSTTSSPLHVRNRVTSTVPPTLFDLYSTIATHY